MPLVEQSKLILAIATFRNQAAVADLCLAAASARGRSLFTGVLIVDSLADRELHDWVDRAGLRGFVRYHNSSTNLGSAGNLHKRLSLAAEAGADYVLAINDDGDLDLAVVERLLDVARRGTYGAVYPLKELAPGRFDLTGSRPFPIAPYRAAPERLPSGELLRVRWSSSNGALYSLEPPRSGVLPPTGLWHGFEDLSYGLLMERAGYRQVLDLTARIESRYEVEEVEILGRSVLIASKPPWLSYYFARNLLLVSTRYVANVGYFLKATVRIGLEFVVVLTRRPQKLERCRRLCRGVVDGLLGREGMTVEPET